MPPLFQSIAPRDLSSPFVLKKKTLDFSKESREGSSEQVFSASFQKERAESDSILCAIEKCWGKILIFLKEPKILIMLQPLSLSFSVILNPARPFLQRTDQIPAPPDTTDPPPPPPPPPKHNTPGQKKEKEGTLAQVFARQSGASDGIQNPPGATEDRGRKGL